MRDTDAGVVLSAPMKAIVCLKALGEAAGRFLVLDVHDNHGSCYTQCVAYHCQYNSSIYRLTLSLSMVPFGHLE